MNPVILFFSYLGVAVIGFLCIRKAYQILDEANEILERAERGEFSDEDSIEEVVKNTPYIPRNVIAVVTRNLSGADEHTTAAIKVLVEKYPKHISGLETSFYMGDKDVVYRESTPTLGWSEQPTKAVIRSLASWLQEQMKGGNPRGIDVMFFEPDITHTRVVDSWHCKSMTFSEVKGYQGEREINPLGRSTPDIYVQFFPMKTERNEEVNKTAQLLLDQMNREAASPYDPPKAEDVSVYTLGEIDLDDETAIHSIRHDKILVPVGVFVGILDDIDPGLCMGNTQPETRQEKLDELIEHLREQEEEILHEDPGSPPV